ncbi:hypothetical protein F3087_15155 [Nocardia colli]|uniref:Uncharacterized protein n=1 Tax=Nocardia colli TaxID=2545717 RepID=A0A5N0EG50_9NOCA|nr:hypothetical protein [Nocardia colli]KAA8888368.1 hypothetical protein F3087_15155 [Nocardia colli]
MAPTTNYSPAVSTAQKILTIAALAAALIGGFIGRSVPQGALLMALGIAAIPAGLLGISLNTLTKNSSGKTQRILYLAMLVAGVVTLVVFLIVRGRSGSPDIGGGFLAIAALFVGLPGLVGTLAIVNADRKTIRQ